METRTVEVPAHSRVEAQAKAILAVRRDRFHPLRVEGIRSLGLLNDGTLFLYEVRISGVSLEEGEARALDGNR